MAGTQPARGTRDFLPDDVRRRAYVIEVVREVYEQYGFEPLETPAFENIETLLGQYGEDGSKLVFKILRRGEHEATGEADLALRYDLTVPLARVVAHHQSALPRFFKRYQIQPVWRADRPARGRFREFYQCDIDAIGSVSPVVEAEVLSAVTEVLRRLGFADFVVRLNDRRVLTGLLARSGVPDSAQASVLVAIDKYEHIGRDGVRQELLERGLSASTAEKTLETLYPVEPDGDVRVQNPRPAAVLERLRESLADDPEGAAAVDNLRAIVTLSARGRVAEQIVIDPSLARGLSYYTGAIMEIAIRDLSGSLGGGGRYDNLVGTFLGRAVPACGFSLGLERIIVVMTERGMFPPRVERGSADVMVTLWDEDSRADLLQLAGELRASGLKVDVYPEADKLGKQLKYAASRRIPFVAVVGDEERSRGVVAIKNLGTGAQVTAAREETPAALHEALVAMTPPDDTTPGYHAAGRGR